MAARPRAYQRTAAGVKAGVRCASRVPALVPKRHLPGRGCSNWIRNMIETWGTGRHLRQRCGGGFALLGEAQCEASGRCAPGVCNCCPRPSAPPRTHCCKFGSRARRTGRSGICCRMGSTCRQNWVRATLGQAWGRAFPAVGAGHRTMRLGSEVVLPPRAPTARLHHSPATARILVRRATQSLSLAAADQPGWACGAQCVGGAFE